MGGRILSIILFGGFLGFMLWPLLTQMHTERIRRWWRSSSITA